jgi:16S rRNA (cytosine967-C5)-methyltransferase
MPKLSRHKPLIYEITSGVIRKKLYLDWVLSHFVKRTIDRQVRFLLWMTLYQVFFMRKAAYHVADEAVDYVKREKGQHVANFVNAVLRRSIRERADLVLPADPVTRLSVEQSFPLWLVRRWLGRFGPGSAHELLDLLNRTPEFCLRIDPRRISREELEVRLVRMGVKSRPGRFLESAVYVDRIGPLLADGLLKEHFVHVQDESSQLAPVALAPQAHERTLDACAGRGTKTDQMAEANPKVRIVAMDLDRKKLLSVRGAGSLIQGDALKNPFKNEVFDSILLDAPCSSLGIIRKHPEIRWRLREADIARRGAFQREMIEALSRNLKSGGRLVYSVCSFEPEETVEVVEAVSKTGFMKLQDPLPGIVNGPYFLSLPHVTGMDGFFIAALRKP